MEKIFSVGDLVVSTAGRDKGKTFLIVKIDNEYAYLVNGKERKTCKPKKKKLKHIDSVLVAGEIELAIKIQKGEPVGNERLRRLIKAQTQKIQED